MEKEFVTYGIAKRLKELGFNEPCFANFLRGKLVYNSIKNELFGESLTDIVLAPLWQQAEDFLSGFGLYPSYRKLSGRWHWKVDADDDNKNRSSTGNGFDSKNEAREDVIIKILEVINL